MLNVGVISSVIALLDKYLVKNSIQEKDIPVITPLLEVLIHNFPLPLYRFVPARLERLTINKKVPPNTDDRINEIKYVRYPYKKYVTKFGRCNVINNPVLYGAFNLLTVFPEMKPETGINVTHSDWQVREIKPLNFFPVFFITRLENEPHNSFSLEIKELHERYTSRFSDFEKKGFDLAMEFFAKCFAKEVGRDNHFDYYLSAYISKRIFDHPTLNYEGIVYPSVQTRLGLSNMAIRADVFDTKFELVEVRHERNSILPNGNGINQVISWSKKFDLDQDLIIWDK